MLRNLTFGEPINRDAVISVGPNLTDHSPEIFPFVVRADGKIVAFCLTEFRANSIARQLRIHGEIDAD